MFRWFDGGEDVVAATDVVLNTVASFVSDEAKSMLEMGLVLGLMVLTAVGFFFGAL